VDDAIVVIENIERHIQEFRVRAVKAASDAMREVLGAVIATGLVLVAVFVPVAFFPGTTGRLYAQFSMTIAFGHPVGFTVTFTPVFRRVQPKESHTHGWFSRCEPRHRWRHGRPSGWCGGWSGCLVMLALFIAAWRDRLVTRRCRHRFCRMKTRASSRSSRRLPARHWNTRRTSLARPGDHSQTT
jgi:HAE1 family hydrophobic/amphiphilic exporter-1